MEISTYLDRSLMNKMSHEPFSRCCNRLQLISIESVNLINQFTFIVQPLSRLGKIATMSASKNKLFSHQSRRLVNCDGNKKKINEQNSEAHCSQTNCFVCLFVCLLIHFCTNKSCALLRLSVESFLLYKDHFNFNFIEPKYANSIFVANFG